MKNFFLVLIVLLITKNQSFAQSEQVKKNSISFNLLGNSTYAGFGYERIFKDRIRAEVGVGIVGAGLGFSYHPFAKIEKGAFSPYIGLKNVYVRFISEYNLLYAPIGVSYFFKNNWSTGLDVGPAYRKIYSPWGKVTEEEYELYPKSEFSLFGNLKLSYHF